MAEESVGDRPDVVDAGCDAALREREAFLDGPPPGGPTPAVPTMRAWINRSTQAEYWHNEPLPDELWNRTKELINGLIPHVRAEVRVEERFQRNRGRLEDALVCLLLLGGIHALNRRRGQGARLSIRKKADALQAIVAGWPGRRKEWVDGMLWNILHRPGYARKGIASLSYYDWPLRDYLKYEKATRGRESRSLFGKDIDADGKLYTPVTEEMPSPLEMLDRKRLPKQKQ